MERRVYCAEVVPFLFVTENIICELIEFRPRSLQLLIYGLLGVNLDYYSAVQVYLHIFEYLLVSIDYKHMESKAVDEYTLLWQSSFL